MGQGKEQFDPAVADSVRLFGEQYTFQEHPGAPGVVWAAAGGRADVYNVADKKRRRWGLKVFFAKIRTQAILQSTEQLRRFEGYEGLMAAHRRGVTPGEGDAKTSLPLHYAVLMPWVPGRTWYDCLQSAESQGTIHNVKVARDLAIRFLRVMEQLESSGVAHTDISAGNVTVEHKSKDTQLIDLEDMYLPQAPKPVNLHHGTPGYSHPAETITWRPSGDRYATAVLTAELLLTSHDTLARMASSSGFFTDNRRNPDAQLRFRQAEPYLGEVAPGFSKLFAQVWESTSLDACPKIRDLLESVNRDAGRVVSPLIRTPVITPAPAEAGADTDAGSQTSESVTWVQDDRVTFETSGDRPGQADAPPAAKQKPSASKRRGDVPAPQFTMSESPSGLGTLLLWVILALFIIFMVSRLLL